MSNFLAIATVTAGLVQLLSKEVVKDVTGATVTNVRPDENGAGLPETGLNLFLYQVTPNTHWRNDDLPTRDGRGRLLQRPRMALDLHYLITFYGDETLFTPQRVLGSTVRVLHDRPVLTEDLINSALNANPGLAQSNLADEIEMVRFVPFPLSLEELSKLWSVFFQIPYTLSMAYQGTVVFIESEDSPTSALPVQLRNIRVMPFRQPVIESVQPEGGSQALILPGDTLVISGRQLRGDETSLRVAGIEVLPQSVADTELRLSLAEPPFAAGELRAGVQGVQVVHKMIYGIPAGPEQPPAEPVEPSPADPHAGTESNVMPFVLRPVITQPAQIDKLQNDDGGTRRGEILISLEPTVGERQRVVVLLNEKADQNASAYTFLDEPRNADTKDISVPFRHVKSGTYLVRVQVDGAESLLDRDGDPPRFTGPEVTIA